MPELQARSSAGAQLSDETLSAFQQGLRGRLASPGSEDYDQARTVWNAMIDRRPTLAVRCAGAADVVRAVRFARENDLPLAVRGGGHNIAGNAVCEGGLQIDLSLMKSVRVDPARRTARVEPGATLADFDR
jgi:FAD/FMN-containing dehydrogenase